MSIIILLVKRLFIMQKLVIKYCRRSIKLFVAYGKTEIYLPYSQSLKDKRMLIKGVIDRLRKRFSISVAEIGGHDLRQRSIIGFSLVSHQHRDLENFLHAIRETFYFYLDQMEVTSFHYEINDVFTP